MSRITSHSVYLKKFRTNFRSGSDVWLFIHIFTLVTLLPFLLHVWSLKRLARVLTPRNKPKRGLYDEFSYIDQIVNYTDFILRRGIWIYRPNCLKRSLILYHFLSKQGCDIQLCLGVRKTQEKLFGHAWLVRYGQVYLEHPSIDVSTYTITCSFSASDFNRSSELTSEMELLLECARYQFHPSDSERVIHILKKPINWPCFLNHVRQHKLLEPAYRALALKKHDAVPDAIITSLKHDNHQFTARAMLLTSELIHITSCLREADINTIAYKGPILAKEIYGKTSTRHFKDLDLLVNDASRIHATKIILSLGYRPRLELEWEHSFICDKTQIMVDLHWGLAPKSMRFDVSFASLWEHHKLIDIAGVPIAALDSENTLIVHCINAAKDDWHSFGQIHDTGQIITTCDLNWELLLCRSDTYDCRRIVLLGVALSAQLFDVPLPPAAKKAVGQEKSLQFLCSKITDKLLQPDNSHKDVLFLNILNLNRIRALSRERWTDKIPHYWRIILHILSPNEKDYAFISFPKLLFPLYLIVRPIRLIRKLIFTLTKKQTD